MPRKKVVSVKPTNDADVARSPVTRGNPGVYMSVANGGTALCNANVNTNDNDTAAAVFDPARPDESVPDDPDPLRALTPPPQHPARPAESAAAAAQRSSRRHLPARPPGPPMPHTPPSRTPAPARRPPST